MHTFQNHVPASYLRPDLKAVMKKADDIRSKYEEDMAELMNLGLFVTWSSHACKPALQQPRNTAKAKVNLAQKVAKKPKGKKRKAMKAMKAMKAAKKS